MRKFLAYIIEENLEDELYDLEDIINNCEFKEIYFEVFNLNSYVKRECTGLGVQEIPFVFSEFKKYNNCLFLDNEPLSDTWLAYYVKENYIVVLGKKLRYEQLLDMLRFYARQVSLDGYLLNEGGYFNIDNVYQKLLTTYILTNNKVIKEIITDLELVFFDKPITQGISYG